MNVKRFVAESFHDACQKIRDELGPDAMIIQTSKVKVGGFLGLFGRWMYEVIAQAAPVSSRMLGGDGSTDAAPVTDLPAGPPPAPPPVALAAPALSMDDVAMIRHELAELRRKVDTLAPAAVALPTAPPPSAPAPGAPPPPLVGVESPTIEVLARPSTTESVALGEMMDLLTRAELDPTLTGKIRSHLLESTPVDDLENLRNLKDRVVDYLSQSLVGHTGIRVVDGQKAKAVAMIGPTGVGKTTTLAKLGAGLKFNMNLDVAFLTVDTYRIAAPEQLKKYAEILDVPIEVVFRPENMIEAIQAFSDKDVILIDTAGRNPKNRADMQDLRAFLDCGYPIESFLVLSATTKYSDMVSIQDDFRDLGASNLIVTKLDETACYGGMISLLSQLKKGVSYVTTGQNVPEDIQPATPAQLARLLFEKRLVA